MQFHLLVFSEFGKMKRKGILFLGCGGVLLSVIAAYLPSLSVGEFSWHELVSSQLFVFNQILFLLSSYVTGVVFAGEFEGGTFDSLASSPLPAVYIVLSKIACLLLSLIGMVALAVISTLSAGCVLPCGIFDSRIAVSYIEMSSYILMLHLVYIPVYILTALIAKKVLAASAMGMFLVLAAIITVSTNFAEYIPPNSGIVLLAELLGNNAYFEQFLHGMMLPPPDATFLVVSSLAIFLIPIPFIPRFYRRY